MARYYGREHFEACTRPPFGLSEWPPWDYTPEETPTQEEESNGNETGPRLPGLRESAYPH